LIPLILRFPDHILCFRERSFFLLSDLRRKERIFLKERNFISENSHNMSMQQAESRVLVIMTGGTICMRDSPHGLVPATGFMSEAMAVRQSFNDASPSGKIIYFHCVLSIAVSFVTF
jgi:L-asparaginase/Glu-tRNA(Gln) amidotransferase subunit D